ncbi:MAG: biotin--[acetyl-CoA-carboxylase] ligase [Eubacteriaceae bacterium]|jgi:BirA family biotin operon repressor/biotin-[acetyl-CoA-carboxylase] ligase
MLSELQKRLKDQSCLILAYDHLESTQSLAREYACCGAPEGTVILAGSQSQGTGQQGRSFFSPPGTGLYMSLILRPRFSPEAGRFITTTAAVAAAQAIEALSPCSVSVKWVNDLITDGRKTGGILTDTSLSPDSSRMMWAVLGMGINIVPPQTGFPEELTESAGSIFQKNSFDAENSLEEYRDQLTAEILERFLTAYRKYPVDVCSSEYKRRLLDAGELEKYMKRKNNHEKTDDQ